LFSGEPPFGDHDETEAPLAASAVSAAVGECGGLRRISAAFLLDERLTPP